MEDSEHFLKVKNDSGLTLKDTTLILLLYADDMALVADPPEDLQSNLDTKTILRHLVGYVLIQRTLVMVFRKRGQLKTNEQLY